MAKDTEPVLNPGTAKEVAEQKAPKAKTYKVIGLRDHSCKLKCGPNKYVHTEIVKGKISHISEEEYTRLTNPMLPEPIVRVEV